MRLVASRGGPQRGRTPPGKAAEQSAPEGTKGALAVELRLIRDMLEESREREAKVLAQLERAQQNERAAWEKVSGLIEGPRQQSWWKRITGRSEK